MHHHLARMQVHLTLDVKLYIVYLYRSVREVKVKMASGVEPDAFFCYNNRDSLYTNERRKSYECKNIKAAGDHPSNLPCGGIHRVAAANRISKQRHGNPGSGVSAVYEDTERRAYPGVRGLPAVEYGAGVRADFDRHGGRCRVAERPAGGILDRGVHLAGDDISGNLRQRAYRADMHEEAGGKGRTGR